MDEPRMECNEYQLPLHLQLYARFQRNEIPASQVRELTQVAELSTHPLIIRTLGLILFQQEQIEAVAELWQDARYYSGLEYMTRQLVEDENYDAAKTFGLARQTLQRFDGSDWQFFAAMIQVEVNTTRNVDQLLALVDQITTLNPAVPHLYTQAGNALMEHRNYIAAHQVYQAGANKFPTESGPWFGLGRNALATNDIHSMCHYFGHALQLDYSAGACNTVNEYCQGLISSEILQLCGNE